MQREVPTLLVLTKTDKLKSMQRKKRIAALRAQLGDVDQRVIATSSQSKQGLQEVWDTIRRML
jgi:GTP-binding protein EngB required for normal cell division